MCPVSDASRFISTMAFRSLANDHAKWPVHSQAQQETSVPDAEEAEPAKCMLVLESGATLASNIRGRMKFDLWLLGLFT